MATVSGAPSRSANAPPINAPNGAIPMNIIEYTDMTRPRRWSGAMVWISVLEDAICSIMQNPAGTRSAAESQKLRDDANRTRAAPKPPHEYATQRPSPRTPVREANVSAASRAPTPVALIRIPRPRAPPCRIRSANTGMSTV